MQWCDTPRFQATMLWKQQQGTFFKSLKQVRISPPLPLSSMLSSTSPLPHTPLLLSLVAPKVGARGVAPESLPFTPARLRAKPGSARDSSIRRWVLPSCPVPTPPLCSLLARKQAQVKGVHLLLLSVAKIGSMCCLDAVGQEQLWGLPAALGSAGDSRRAAAAVGRGRNMPLSKEGKEGGKEESSLLEGLKKVPCCCSCNVVCPPWFWREAGSWGCSHPCSAGRCFCTLLSEIWDPFPI